MATVAEKEEDARRCKDWWAGYYAARGGTPLAHPDVPTSPDGRGGWAQGKIDHDDMADDRRRVRVVMHDEHTTRTKRSANQLAKEQAERDGRAAAEKAKGMAAVAEAERTGKPEPLAVVCPQCHSGIGEKCRNYVNAWCAPHGERVRLAKELADQAKAEAQATDPRLAKLNALDAA
ncbi:MAG TPA: hypothetical protein VFI13_09395 [Gemmatimonadales bacterium]|nr:hypothetical protein [Gemmatimonadales bacterium]